MLTSWIVWLFENCFCWSFWYFAGQNDQCDTSDTPSRNYEFFYGLKAFCVGLFLSILSILNLYFYGVLNSKIVWNCTSLQLSEQISCYFEPRNVAVANIPGQLTENLYTKIEVYLKLQLRMHTGTSMFS